MSYNLRGNFVSTLLFLTLVLGILQPPVTFRAAQAEELATNAQPEAIKTITTDDPTTDASTIALNYIAEQEKIPAAELQIAGEEEQNFPLLGRNYRLVTIVHSRKDTFREFQLLVDPETKAVEPDVVGVRMAERAAYQKKYEKFDPPLYDRLQASQDSDLIVVAIWATEQGVPDSLKAAEAEVAKLFPEADKALKERGIPWSVDDQELRLKIKQKFAEQLEAHTSQRTKAILAWLKAKGYQGEVYTSTPVVTATMSKADILALAKLGVVAQLNLAEGRGEPESNVAIPTSRVPAVTRRKFNGNNVIGSGVRLAIIEQGNIDATTAGCLNIITTRSSTLGSKPHKSMVAAIAACKDQALPGVATLPGTASGPQMLDAGHDNIDQTSAAQALIWAVDSNFADVTNESEGFTNPPYNDTTLYYLDKFYDYQIRTYKFTAVKSAGNSGGNVTTPGKGWNIITVGNNDDMNTPAWGDDNVHATSAYINPSSGAEKPEVAAPGTDINTVAGAATGSSLSAPQVAGLAALLMQRDTSLKDMPSAVRAIIMASAIHNLEGSKRLSDQDGAGGIDANLADWIVMNKQGQCYAACWWHVDTTDSGFPVGGTLDRFFTVTQGERVRVVISWLSAASADGVQDDLRTNYNLNVIRPNGSSTASSSSTANGFEIVDFTAPETGQYTIRVSRVNTGLSESTNFLGIAWLKEGTYLPEIRTDNGWSTTIYVRNDGAQTWDGKLTFLNASGSVQSESAPSGGLAKNTVWSGATLPVNWRGSAIFEGNDNVSITVVNRRASAPFSSSAYTGVPNTKTSGTSYLPLVMRNAPSASGTVNSEILIQNAAGVSTSAQVQFYGSPGNYTSPGITIAPGATYVYNIQNEGNLANGWVGTAVVTGGQINVISHLRTGSNNVQTYQGLTAESAGTAWAMPFFFSRLANGLSSPVAVQNISGSQMNAGTVTLSCVKDPGSPAPATLSVTNNAAIPNNGAFYFNPVTDTTNFPTGWYGACRIAAPSNAVSFIQMRFVGTDNAGAYEALPGNGVSKVAIFPLIQKRVTSGAYILGTSLAIQNLSTTAAANVKFYYRSSAGVDISPEIACVIPAGGSVYHNHRLTDPNTSGCNLNNGTMPDGWTGSLVVTSSDQPIAGVTQVTNVSSPSGDTFMLHNANMSP